MPTYTIKDVAKQFQLPISTIRYYDDQGLLPFVARDVHGNRVFTDSDLNLIKTIVCLKTTGMPLKQIRQYIQLCLQGPTSIPQRQALLAQHKAAVLRQQQTLAQALQEIEVKLNRYSAPNAVGMIQAELAYVAQEKAALDLPNAFAH